MEAKLYWNVYEEDFNARKIVSYNIFSHYGFLTALIKIQKELDKRIAIYKRTFLKDKQIDADKLLDNYKQELKATYFIPEIDRALQYYFWAKSEHEVVITSWPPYITKAEFERLGNKTFAYRECINLDTAKKIDIYDQVKLNFSIFIDYLWDNFKKIPKKI